MSQGFYTKTKNGVTAHVLGDRNMSDETLKAIHSMIDLAYKGLGDRNKTHSNKMSETKTPTLGEQRVRVSFNPSNESVVDTIKQKSAEIIDLLQAVRADEVSKTYDKTPEDLQAQSGEKLRLIALAQTAYEEAAMWAVKAATA